MKPGYRTSEYWLTTALSLISVLVGLGVIPTADQGALVDATKAVVSGVIGVWTVVSYIESRTQLKTATMKGDQV